MALFGVMGFVENEQVDLIDVDERVHQALAQDISRADNDHVFLKMLLPCLLGPKLALHRSAEAIDFVVQIGLEHSELLEHQGDRVDLRLG